MRTTTCLVPHLLFAVLVAASAAAGQKVVRVADTAELREALASARPGTVIELAADGAFEGDVHAPDVRGREGRPIVIRAADAEHPPVIRGGDGSGLHLSNAAWVELRDLHFEGARVNGINIDDGGDFESPSVGIVLERVTVRDVGPEGNSDAIKLSGLVGFHVVDCRVERWGSGGSAIDLVGCHDGTVEGCTFVHLAGRGASGVQAKGGSRDVVVRSCRFEHAGQRAVSLGGSTGLVHFRPEPQGFEAKDLTVEGCTFIGSAAPIAFVGVDGAVVRRNTIYRPERWVLRILQESTEDFVPCRNGEFTENLIVLDAEVLRRVANVGPNTAPETFTFTRNAWFCEDSSTRRPPPLPVDEQRGVYGRRPRFVDAAALDLRQHARSPLRAFGADALR